MHVRSQQHALHGGREKNSPNTQISISCRFAFPSAPEVTGQANSLQILGERFALSFATPCKPSAATALCRFCLKAAPAPQTPLSPISAPAALLAQSCFCNTHTAQAQQRDFGQAPERGRMLGQSGSRHQNWHSTAFSIHPPSLSSATPPSDGWTPQVTA